MIQELDSTEHSSNASSAQKKIQEVPTIPYSWDDAEVVELKGQFIAQADHVFLNISLKGYKKDEDVHFALSENEILLEIRDRSVANGPGRKKRICQTLHKQIDVA